MNNNFTSMLRSSAVGVGLVSATILVGCSSDPAATPAAAAAGGMSMPPPPATMMAASAAKSDFLTNVYPKLKDEKCTSCHVTGVAGAPKYLGDSAEASYTSISKNTAVYASSAESSLLTKGAHQGSPALSDEAVAAAKKWLDAEFPPEAAPGEAAPEGGGSVVGFNSAIQEFIKCMAQDDWEQHMKNYPFLQTQTVGNCAGCHHSGNAGTFLNADVNITFKAMKTVPYVYRLVQAVYEGDSIVDLAPSNRLIDKGQITTDCFDPNNVICHDTYNVPKIQAQGLKNFQTLTAGKLDGLKCVGF
jgi:hypothetical protein